MAADPRRFTVKACPKTDQGRINQQNTRRDFFSQLGKIGDLEVLNDIKGANSIGKGLRTLASISNSVRVGQGALPTVIGQSIDSGANWVLGAMGFDSTTLAGLDRLQPGIANQALGQAKVIYSNIKQGNFNLQDIPFYLQDFQNLERLVRNIFVDGPETGAALKQVCDASPYAIDLVTTKSPKYKFLFVVEFVFNGEYASALKSVNDTFAFTCQTSTRPQPRYNMEEINMYNYRTKIITRTEFEEMKMSFYDDQSNVALDFYNAFMKSTIPITNIASPMEASAMYDEGGMAFTRRQGTNEFGDSEGLPVTLFPYYAGSYTPPVLESAGKNIFREIKLYEVFDWGRRFNAYRFINPRIMTLQLDDLDMAGGTNPTMFNLQFNYDAVSIIANQDLSAVGGEIGDPKQLTRTGLYPLQYVGESSTPNNTSVGSGVQPPTQSNILGTGEAWQTPPYIPQGLQNAIPTVQGDYQPVQFDEFGAQGYPQPASFDVPDNL